MSDRIFIYANPKKNQKKEQLFVEEIQKIYSNSVLVKQVYTVSPNSIANNLVDITALKNRIQNNIPLTNRNKNHLLDELSLLPQFVKIGTPNSFISVDVAIQENETVRFIEFHEKQHRSISIKKIRKKSRCFVFSTENIAIEVPRSVQRFLRDIWRVQYLNNFSIVWWDWFEANKDTILSILENNKIEYNLPNKFSFSEFLG